MMIPLLHYQILLKIFVIRNPVCAIVVDQPVHSLISTVDVIDQPVHYPVKSALLLFTSLLAHLSQRLRGELIG